MERKKSNNTNRLILLMGIGFVMYNLFLYVLGGFIAWEINAENWDALGRTMFVLFGPILYLIISCVVLLNISYNKKTN
jgi:uncharacterized membrane protein YqjE